MHGYVLQKDIVCKVDYLKITNDLPDVEFAAIDFIGEKRNIGTKINSSKTDIAPIISPDHSDNYGGRRDEADIWYSHRKADGS